MKTQAKKVAFRRTIIQEVEVEVDGTEDQEKDEWYKDVAFNKINYDTQWRQREESLEWIYSLSEEKELCGFIIGFDKYGDFKDGKKSPH